MTHKEPTGGKHGQCITHVPHPYTSNGWLCVDDEPGRAAVMVEFADHLAAVRALHHAAELLRPAGGATHDSMRAELERLIAATEHLGDEGAKQYRAALESTLAHTSPPPETSTHFVGIGSRIEPASRVKVEPIKMTGPDYKPASVKARKTSTRHIHRTSDGGAVYAGDTCAECGHAPIAQTPEYAAAVQESQILSPGARNVVPEYTGPDDGPTAIFQSRADDPARIAAIVQYGPAIAERAAAFVDEHPMHDLKAVAGSIARADAILAAPRVRSIDEPSRTSGEPIPSAYQVRPVLAILPDVDRIDILLDAIAGAHNDHDIIAAAHAFAALPDARTADDRPRCPRCGQTFRKHGVGAEWHRINRPDCAAEYRRATA